MKIAIISDVHNNITNLTKVLSYCKQEKIEKIICCGDLASMEMLDFLNDNFSGESYFCFGNMDDGHLKNYDFGAKYKNTWIFSDYGKFEIDNHTVAFVHYPEKAKRLCENGKYDFVFHGHTHKPWTEKINDCTILNPGNVASEIYPPTFAIWNVETEKFELIRINELKNNDRK